MTIKYKDTAFFLGENWVGELTDSVEMSHFCLTINNPADTVYVSKSHTQGQTSLKKERQSSYGSTCMTPLPLGWIIFIVVQLLDDYELQQSIANTDYRGKYSINSWIRVQQSVIDSIVLWERWVKKKEFKTNCILWLNEWINYVGIKK